MIAPHWAQFAPFAESSSTVAAVTAGARRQQRRGELAEFRADRSWPAMEFYAFSHLIAAIKLNHRW